MGTTVSPASGLSQYSRNSDVFFLSPALVAEEYLDGDISSEVQQPFSISHDPNSGAPTGEMSLVDPSASSTSGWILQPGRQQATATESSSVESVIPSGNGETPTVAALDSSPQATAPAEGHEHDGDGSIEENLHLLVDDLEPQSA